MRKQNILAIGFLALLFAVVFGSPAGRKAFEAKPVYAAGGQTPPSACTFPTQMAATPEQTAWAIFVAATCPSNGGGQYPYVVWENWLEQHQVYPASSGALKANAAPTAARERFFKSGLGQLVEARSRAAKSGGKIALMAPAQGCTVSKISGRTICEEVRINPIMVDWLWAGNLEYRAGQAAAAAQYLDIQMPAPSVEIKVDWIQLASCSNLPTNVHTEQVDGVCYALAGMHLISKLLNQWIWATFEPQNLTTNPLRCKVLGCTDGFGSSPASSKGGAGGVTSLTPALQSLMTNAGLAPEWFNYRLDGAQITYVDSIGTPTMLGNSIIEGENAGVPLNQSSCISCHAVSSVQSNGTDGITLLTSNPVGTPFSVPLPLPSNASGVPPAGQLPDDTWIRRDFLWSMGMACPNAVFQTCSATSFAAKKSKP